MIRTGLPRVDCSRGAKRAVIRACALAAALLLSISASAAGDAAEPTEQPPVQKEGPGYILVDAGDLQMAVGVELAQQDRDNRGFIPLVVSIFDLKHKLVRIRKDEFHLFGEGGEELPMATLKEVRSEYKWYRQDNRAILTSGFLSSLPFADNYQPTNFFPTPGSVGIYAVTLDFKQTFIDLLYFRGEWRQRLRLIAEANRTRPALEVSFHITDKKD